MLTMKSKKADIYAAYMALVQEPAAPKPQGIEKLMSQVASHKKGVTQTDASGHRSPRHAAV